MVKSTGTDGWLPPHLRMIQSLAQSIPETNTISPPKPISTTLRVSSPPQHLQPGVGDHSLSPIAKANDSSGLPSTQPVGYHSVTSLPEEENNPPHPYTAINQKQEPQAQSVTAQQWKASLNAHLEKYRSGRVSEAHVDKPPSRQVPPHLRALSSIPIPTTNVQDTTPPSSSCPRQNTAIQPSAILDPHRPSPRSPMVESREASPLPQLHSTHLTASTIGQSPLTSNHAEPYLTYLEASSAELDLLPAHLEVLEPVPTTAPSKLTRAHLAAFDRMTVTPGLSLASVSSDTTTQMTHKPKIDKGKGREVQLPLPASPHTLPPAKVRTGDAAIWTKKADIPELMKMSKDYPCPYEDCRLGFDNLKALRRHKTEKHEYCKKCDSDFKDFQDHLDHKIESSEHITCPVCGDDFRSTGGRDVHIRTMHPNPQDLSCPGCGAKFVRAGSLIDHIEKSKCLRISVDQFERYRAVNAIKNAHLTSLEFDEDGESLFAEAEATESVGGVDLVTENGEDEDSISSLSNAIDAAVIQDQEPSSSKATEEFPALGASTPRSTAGALPPRQSGPRAKIPAWSTPGSTSHKVFVAASKQNPEDAKQFSESGTARYSRPVLVDMTTGSVPVRPGLTFSNGQPVEAIDPTSANYNPDAFKTILDTWKCPYPKCGKSYPTRQAFTGHQSSQAHKGVDHRCPECLRIYQDATALTQHMEASSSRCKIKLSKHYDKIVGMVSGGIIRVEGQHVDGTVRYDAGEPQW